MKVGFDKRWMRSDGIGRFLDGITSHTRCFFEPLRPPVSIFNPLEQFWLASRLLGKKYEVFFTPGINPPVLSRVPFVFAIHDLIPLQLTGETSFKKVVYYKTVLRLAVARARRILTVSKFSKGEIVNWFNVDPDQIVVVGNGVDRRFSPEGASHNPGSPYLLYVGNRRSHKNVAAAIQGYARSGIASELRFVLSGHPDPDLYSVIAKNGVEDRVDFARFIPEEKLPAYYRGATALVHPSLHEGFGLPVLEALACGTPVVASNATAIPEVTGDAALLFDPTNIDEIASSIRKIVLDDSLRNSLEKRGPARAKKFSWEKVARRTESALRAAVA